MFRKVLIANRGEIAVRIIRTLREMEIRTVAIYSDADRASLHVRKAADMRRRVRRGSSLSEPELPEHCPDHRHCAPSCGVDAIHPGYGFLSENADFAAACEAAGIVFIGPPAMAIRQMGSKTGARQIAAAAGAPIVPGVHEGSLEPRQALEFSRAVGYPVMLKAVAGGGGKGMRRVDREEDLEGSFRDASSEAERSFADGFDLCGEIVIERPAAYRDPGIRRPAWELRAPGRTRMFHPA